MHRLGFEESEVEALADHLAKNNLVKVQSVFSHLVASEDEGQNVFTQQQANVFMQCCDVLQKRLGYHFLKHIANTSSISRHPYLQFDMVRLGIGLYGIDSNNRLKNVTTLKTTIAQLKKVKAGDSVGYGRNAKLKKDSLIATVRIGYADGYPRSLGNGAGKMLVQNKMVNVTGNVCMDMTMLDVTGMQNIKEGDEVIVFGEDLPIQMLAKWSNTIAYEIMTGISQRVKRVYFEE
jgi:alanine racemase